MERRISNRLQNSQLSDRKATAEFLRMKPAILSMSKIGVVKWNLFDEGDLLKRFV